MMYISFWYDTYTHNITDTLRRKCSEGGYVALAYLYSLVQISYI